MIKKGTIRPRAHVLPMIEARNRKRLADPEGHRKMVIANLPKDCNGSKNGNWKGGISKLRSNHLSVEQKKWSLRVRKRDGFKCRVCGSTQRIEAHHIIPISLCEATAWMDANGVALCKTCHYKHDKAWQGERYKSKIKPRQGSVIAFTIPYIFQEYQTCGNYKKIPGGGTLFFINDMGNEDYAFLVLIHEMVEEHLTRRRGLTEPEIMAFDEMWEKENLAGKHGPDDEPGHDPRAPYRNEHIFAENIERLIAGQMGLDWNAYGDAVIKSCEEKHPKDD